MALPHDSTPATEPQVRRMEGRLISTLEETLTCPVCQDILMDPRQLPCGHTICMGCLEKMVDHSHEMPFRCPTCREFFGRIINLQRNFTLSSIVKDFRENISEMLEQRKRVYCDCCLERSVLAVRTCLKCEASLCQEHLQDHLRLPVFLDHTLVEPSADLQQRKCPKHEDQVLMYYCSVSRRYVCRVCASESKQHSHITEALADMQRHIKEYIDQHFKTLKDLMTECNVHVKNLQRDIERKSKESIPDSSAFSSVSVLLVFLWVITLYYAYSYSAEKNTLAAALDVQRNRVDRLQDSIVELLAERREESHDYQTDRNEGTLRLDEDTASPLLGISVDLRTVKRVKTKLSYPSSSKRFDEAPQVLSAQCFSSGVHVWEVEVEGYWDVAVSYSSIKRKSKYDSAFGNNAQSWSLLHNGQGQLFAYHNREKTQVSGGMQGSRLAVMVDFEEGNIAFSTQDPTVRQLHVFQAELTEPVCLGLGLYRLDPPSRASLLRVS